MSENILDEDGQGRNGQEGERRGNLLLLQFLRAGELSGIEETIRTNMNILWRRNYIEESPGFPETADTACDPHFHHEVGGNA
jgi:hypothetical protein